jgi:hypothetical protein
MPQTQKNKPIYITSDFESGNIIVSGIKNREVYLEIKKDPYPKHVKRKYQSWFYFKAGNVKNKNIKFVINNIKLIQLTWEKKNDWDGFNVCYSYDNKKWVRYPTTVIGDEINWTIKPKKNTVWFAFYPPYPFSRTKQFFSNGEIIGHSNMGNPIYMRTFGNGPVKIWIIARQHPGETIGSWIMEGVLKQILKKKKKLAPYTIRLIGNANPDGTILGHWYVNKTGVNLNRDWTDNPKSPEIKVIKKQIHKYGCDLFFDLHGDEGVKKHFLVNPPENQHILHNTINRSINQKDKDFTPKCRYPKTWTTKKMGTADDYWGGITVEGAMKHKLYGKTLQNEPLNIGKDLVETLLELQE